MAGFINETLQKQDLKKLSKSKDKNTDLLKKLGALVKSENFKQTYFLYGEESYLIDYYKNELVKAISGDNELNITTFDAQSFDRDAFSEIAMTLPFFAEKRVIVLSYTGLFGKKVEPNIEELKKLYTDEEIEKILAEYDTDDLFENIPETTVLIITDNKVAKNRKLVKNLLKNGEAYQIKYQDPDSVKTWINTKMKAYKISISPRACEMLVERIGVDLNTINSETDKLISFSTNGSVDVADVEAITSDRFENRVFDMLELAVSGRMNQAFDLYKDILALNGEPIAILVMMGKQISKYLAALEIYNKTRNSYDVGNKVSVFYFDRVARFLNREKLEKALERYMDLDRSVKEGNIDQKLAPELLIAYLAS